MRDEDALGSRKLLHDVPVAKVFANEVETWDARWDGRCVWASMGEEVSGSGMAMWKVLLALAGCASGWVDVPKLLAAWRDT